MTPAQIAEAEALLGFKVEVLPITECPHHGRVPHRQTHDGLSCAVCLLRPGRYALTAVPDGD